MNAGTSAAAPAPPAALPADLQANPRLSRWIVLQRDGTVGVRVGKVEIGQGITTALAQIAAAALGVAVGRIRMLPVDTATSPNEGVTAGSLSVQAAGAALRQACAEARALLRAAAAERLGVPAECLVEADGTWRAPGADGVAGIVHLADFADADLLERDARGDVAPPREPARDIVGRSLPRRDLPDKLAGRARFIHDLRPDGLRWGRVLRPPSPAAGLVDVDLDAVRALPGVVAAVRDGRFIGVVADDEWRAELALRKLSAVARWSEPATLPDLHALPDLLRGAPCETRTYAQQQAAAPLPPVARRFTARYARPYLAHASIGPSCALARWDDARLEVWSHSQGIFNLRDELARVFGRAPGDVVVHHVEGAGCYGHNGADDAACDAALLARAVPGEVVRVQWSRADELAWSPLGAAMAVELTAEVDADGNLVTWRHEVWSNGHSSRPGRGEVPVLLAATHVDGAAPMPAAINMPLAAGGGAERNSIPVYRIPQWDAVCHRWLEMPLRTSSLRSLGAHANVFASESFVDEIARALGIDPLEYRLRHLDDARMRAVLERAAAMAGWTRRKTAGRALGLAVSRYKNTGAWCAAVAEVDVEREPRVTRLWLAVDVGLAVNPDGVKNQIEGGAIQTVSWTTKERAAFDRTRVTSAAWDDYPILRFSEVPTVEVDIVDRPHDPPLGAGEATQGPVAAAIANAYADALEVRVREMPLTTDALTRSVLSAS
jgi:CO/xanthine dehydrogenase Mo-binding subunit